MQNMNISRLAAAMYRTGQSIITEKMQGLDLKSGQLDSLYVIILHEGITQLELSELLFVGKSATAKTVKILVQKGYVEQRTDTQDRRICHLYLTEKGRRVAPDVQQIFKELVQLHLRSLTAEEATTMMGLMEKVLTGLLQENDKTIREDENYE